LTLLTDQTTESATQLYVLSSIYVIASLVWWVLFRRFQAIYCLSIPFFVYALAFFLIGLPSFNPFANARGWINNVGTAFYAFASASGSLFFSLNFADEGKSHAARLIVGGAPVTSWVWRACVIQGTQQMFATGLWYWGHRLSALSAAGMLQTSSLTTSVAVTAITWPVAVALVLAGLSLYFGLPEYYRQIPGGIPAFYNSLRRRKLVVVHFRQAIPSKRLVVLRRRCITEFLAERPLWPELVLSLERSSPHLADNCPHPHLFHRCLVCVAPHPRGPLQKPFLDSPGLCHRFRRPSLVSNVVGNNVHRI
jgi:glycogen synthase